MMKWTCLNQTAPGHERACARLQWGEGLEISKLFSPPSDWPKEFFSPPSDWPKKFYVT